MQKKRNFLKARLHTALGFFLTFKNYVMAIYKLGAIVTSIVGSIGGTTFRRGKNSLVIQRKSFGGARSTLLKNKRLGQIQQIFTMWRDLSEALKSEWNYQATLFQFPDKFGVLKYLTGRELFTKLNLQLIPIGQIIDTPTGLNTTVEIIEIVDILADIALQDMGVRVSSPLSSTTVLIQIEVSDRPFIPPTFIRREVLGVGTTVGAGLIDCSEKFFAKYPYATALMYVTVYATPINSYGFKGITVYNQFQLS